VAKCEQQPIHTNAVNYLDFYETNQHKMAYQVLTVAKSISNIFEPKVTQYKYGAYFQH